jgi:hypothetical protein
MKCPPVLLLIFNRPDLARRVFESIRQARPEQLFIAADGARADRPAEAELCRRARKVVERVDWKCEVHHLYREQNLGCGLGPATAMDWFFEHVEEGIILEDDCLPDASFFPFCGELLEKYRTDDRVVHIAAINPMAQGLWLGAEDYKFWHFGGIWAWATWRRAWKLFDMKMAGWPEFQRQNKLAACCSCPAELSYRTEAYRSIHAGVPGVWDSQWAFARIQSGGLSITPRVNLVSNIGFDGRATHTRDEEHSLARLRTKSVALPLTHPARVAPDYVFGKSFFESLQLGVAEKRPDKRNFFQRMAKSIRKRVRRIRGF